MVKSLAFKILFLSWMMFVTFSSLFSFEGLQTSRFDIPHMDKIVHFVFYFGIVVFGFFAIKKSANKWSAKQAFRSLIYVLIFAILYGIFIELAQYMFTSNRHGDVLDALANSVGAMLGMLFVKILFLKKLALK